MAAVRAGLFCTVLLAFCFVAVLIQLLRRVSDMAVPRRWPGIMWTHPQDAELCGKPGDDGGLKAASRRVSSLPERLTHRYATTAHRCCPASLDAGRAAVVLAYTASVYRVMSGPVTAESIARNPNAC